MENNLPTANCELYNIGSFVSAYALILIYADSVVCQRYVSLNWITKLPKVEYINEKYWKLKMAEIVLK